MSQPSLDPHDAPFNTTTIPTGWSRPLTAEEAALANALYPVPPYGNTYSPPGPPTPPPFVSPVQFIKLTGLAPAGIGQSTATVRDEDLENLVPGQTIFALWPIAGVLGIVDDVGARPARVLAVSGNQITINYDSNGLDVTGLVLVGVVYIGG